MQSLERLPPKFVAPFVVMHGRVRYLSLVSHTGEWGPTPAAPLPRHPGSQYEPVGWKGNTLNTARIRIRFEIINRCLICGHAHPRRYKSSAFVVTFAFCVLLACDPWDSTVDVCLRSRVRTAEATSSEIGWVVAIWASGDGTAGTRVQTETRF